MSKWDERVNIHAVMPEFTSVLGQIENLGDDLKAQAPEDVDRLAWAVNHVRDRVIHAPAQAVPHATLNTLQQQLSTITPELSNLVSTGNASYLANANNNADALLVTAGALPPLPSDAVAEAIAADAERVRRVASETVERANTELVRVREEADASQQAMTQAREEFTAQVAAVNQELSQVRTQVQQQTTRLEQALATHETQFGQAERERASAFEAAERERAGAASTAQTAASEDFDSTATALKQDAEETLTELARLRREAEELVGAIGVAGVAAGYNETAKHEKKAADQWRIATVGVAAVAVLVLASALLIDHSVAGSWQRLITRLVVSVSFAGVAAYCGRQSEAHRTRERTARDRQIQLAALNPYLANMPDDESVKLKLGLAPGYFTPSAPSAPSAAHTQDGETKSSNGPLSEAQMAQIADLIKTLITKGAK